MNSIRVNLQQVIVLASLLIGVSLGQQQMVTIFSALSASNGYLAMGNSNYSLSIYLSLLTRSNETRALADSLEFSGQRKVALFAPTDESISQPPEASLDDLVQYHCIPNFQIPPVGWPESNPLWQKSLLKVDEGEDGIPISLVRQQDQWFVWGGKTRKALIVTGPVSFSNGYLFVIAGWMQLPGLFNQLDISPTFVGLLKKYALINGNTPAAQRFTILNPPEDRISSLLALKSSVIEMVLRRHLIPNTFLAFTSTTSDKAATVLQPLSSDDQLQMRCNKSQITFSLVSNPNVSVLVTEPNQDFTMDGSALHQVDRLLIDQGEIQLASSGNSKFNNNPMTYNILAILLLYWQLVQVYK